MLKTAFRDALRKFDPRALSKNFVIFVTAIGALVATVVLIRDAAAGQPFGFTLQVTLWLWFTVLFANFAEALAEGRGKAQADALKKMRVYVNGWSGGSLDPVVIREKAQLAMAAGYDAFKFSLALPVWPMNDPGNLRKIAKAAETIRETIGPDALLMFDGHGRYDADLAIRIGKIFEPLDFTFFEEPCQPEDEEGLAKVAAHVDIPIATGERLSFLPEFKRLLTRNCASVIQPDIGHSCGFGTALKAARLAEAFNAFVAPHGPMSPVITTISLHLDAIIPNFLIQERLFLNDWRNEVITEPLKVEDGYIKLNDKPGWGIELNEELCKAHPAIPPYTPQLYRPDGAVCDW